MSSTLRTTYQEAGFTFEEMQRVQSSILEADAGKLIPEELVWRNIRENSKAYV